MKRIIAILLCAILLYSLAACGNKEETEAVKSSVPSVTDSSSKPSGPKYDSEPVESFPKADYPLNRETMSYDEYFSTERPVFRTSVYDGWEVSGKNVFVEGTNELIFSAPDPIDYIFLGDHVYYYISGDKLYRYHVDSWRTDFICNAENVNHVNPITNMCGALFMDYIEEGEKDPAVRYFYAPKSKEILEESYHTGHMVEITERSRYLASEFEDFPDTHEMQSKSINEIWNLWVNFETRPIMSYDEYFSEERCFEKGNVLTKIEGNKVVETKSGKVLLEAEGPIQHIDVSDYLIYYSCNNKLYRYHIDSKQTDFICSTEGYTHFGASTNMAGVLYKLKKEGEDTPETDYFDMYTGNEIIDESERIKALGKVLSHCTYNYKSEMFEYTPYELQSLSIYQIAERNFAWWQGIGNINLDNIKTALEQTRP